MKNEKLQLKLNASIIVGLGNPGRKYKYTRHNLGFRVVEQFAKRNNFPKFRLVKKFQAEISEGMLEGKNIILAKPQTFMNNSGRAVKQLASNFRLPTSNLFIVHDDMDLPLGKIKISVGRGAAGHKGVESIIEELGTKNFLRVRIGITNYELRIRNKPPHLCYRCGGKENFVLGKFTPLEGQFCQGGNKNSLANGRFRRSLKPSPNLLTGFTKEEKKIVKQVIKKASQALKIAITKGFEKAMTEFNQ